MSTVIRTSGLVKRYGRVNALDGLDLSVDEGQVHGFCAANPDFDILPTTDTWQKLFGADKPQPWSRDGKTVTLTPASTDTDGFFFCAMSRKA